MSNMEDRAMEIARGVFRNLNAMNSVGCEGHTDASYAAQIEKEDNEDIKSISAALTAEYQRGVEERNREIQKMIADMSCSPQVDAEQRSILATLAFKINPAGTIRQPSQPKGGRK